jgi:hypothetical protein
VIAGRGVGIQRDRLHSSRAGVDGTDTQYSAEMYSTVEYVPWMRAKGPCFRAPPEKPSACR